MKKTFVFVACLSLASQGFAQKSNIQSANNSLKDKDYTKALEYIEKAVNDPSTKDDPKAWFVKGNIYSNMQAENAKGVNAPYREALNAYTKVIQLKPTYEKEAIDNELLRGAQLYYNDAANAYQSKKYDDAVAYAKEVVKVHDIDGGKRFSSYKMFDTIANQALVIHAFSAYQNNNYDEALNALVPLKNSAISAEPNVYLVLAEIYEKQNKETELKNVLAEGRQKFPDNKEIRNADINLYIKAGRQDELIQKLEAEVAKDPGNVDLQSNLADTYTGLAFPKASGGKEAPQPVNFTELIKKAETAYTAALAGNPNNANVNFNAGVLYYNQATSINQQMNNIKGNSAADQKKYDDLKTQRGAFFMKAMPYFEKSVSSLEAKGGTMTPDDKFTYQSALIAMKEIYIRQDDMTKANAVKAKLEALKK